MNLIRFLTIGSLCAIVLGEFGKYPFGDVGNSLNLLDFLSATTVAFFLIWKIGIQKQIDIPKVFYGLFIFVGLGLISLVLNQNFSGLLYLIRFIIYSLFFWVGFEIQKDGKKEVIEYVMIVVGIVIAGLGFLQLLLFPDLTFLTDFGYDPHILRLSSTFLDPNFVGGFLTIIYSVGLMKYLEYKNQWIVIILGVLFLAIILTFSRSAWIFFGVVNIFTIWFLPKKIIVGLVLFSLLAFIFIPRIQQRIVGALQVDLSAGERFLSWEKGIELFNLNPALGIGFNNIRSVSLENGLIRPFTPDGGNSGNGIDSSWLLILVTTGVIGFVFYGYFYVSLLWYFLKEDKSKKNKNVFLVLSGLMTGLFIESQFINSLFYPQIMMVFFILTGMYYATNRQNT